MKIKVVQTVLDDLQALLKQTRWTGESKVAGCNDGTYPNY